MNSPALVMAWQIWTRHRLGIRISAVCLLLMVIAFPPILRNFDSKAVFVLTMIPAALVSVYVANLLLFTDEVGSLTSGYPRRMFTLPVTTRTLVLWPMLIALLTVLSLWLVISVLVYQRGGYRPPLILPALAIAVIMAWSQTVAWLPTKSQLVQGYTATIGFALLLGVPFWLLVVNRVSSTEVTVIGLVELPALCSWHFSASPTPAGGIAGHLACKTCRTGTGRPWIAFRGNRPTFARRQRRSSGTRTVAMPGCSRVWRICSFS